MDKHHYVGFHKW